MSDMQIWYCTRTGKHEIKPQNMNDRRELYAWSKTNISAFRDEDRDDRRIAYTSSVIDEYGCNIWKRIELEDVPLELKTLTLLVL